MLAATEATERTLRKVVSAQRLTSVVSRLEVKSFVSGNMACPFEVSSGIAQGSRDKARGNRALGLGVAATCDG